MRKVGICYGFANLFSNNYYNYVILKHSDMPYNFVVVPLELPGFSRCSACSVRRKALPRTRNLLTLFEYYAKYL